MEAEQRRRIGRDRMGDGQAWLGCLMSATGVAQQDLIGRELGERAGGPAAAFDQFMHRRGEIHEIAVEPAP